MRDLSQRWASKTCAIYKSPNSLVFITLSGRVLWALTRLHEAGATGCTTLQTGVPRLAAYVHKLRKLGVSIETIKETNHGEFFGYHARYVLHSKILFDVGGKKPHA
jgi:hypothetical protein